MPYSPESERVLDRLVSSFDALLVGQEDAKRALLLAILSRQHVYLEGEPGCGKSLLIEGLARLVGARAFVIAFHRDIREIDLLGDPVLSRQKTERGELLRRDLAPGPLLSSEIAVLEELPRAPGEALGPLLRILADRKALGRNLPLECAFATGPPEVSAVLHGAPIDPLEPSQLDRFALQVRMRGLLRQRQWRSAERVIARSADGGSLPGTGSLRDDPTALEAVIDTAERHQLQAEAAVLEIAAPVRSAYLDLIEKLRDRAATLKGSEGSVLLSDRTFGRSIWDVVRAHARLRRATRVEIEDLRALRLMVARRLPEALQQELDQMIEELVEEDSPEVQIAVSGSQVIAGPAYAGEGKPTDTPRTAAILEQDEEAFDLEPERRELSVAAEVGILMEALIGRIERGRNDPETDPGGQPRSYRPLRRLDELLDGDLIEAILYAEGRLPGAPRTYHRKRRNAGGAMIVLRDISASMAGTLATWAGEVVAGIVRVAAQRRMRVGYIEFHHKAVDYPVAGRLLNRSYSRLFELAAASRTLGQTNYEAPLRMALEALKGGMGRNRHIVMLTDGLPIIGDPTVRKERALAKKLGVQLHTVFLGSGDCPPVLDELSRETGGLRFQARPDARGQLLISEREELRKVS
jgi:MoxR-like ATPase/Mg-chelatase subunit ChlD